MGQETSQTSVTSILRAGDQRVSRNQIAIVLGVVVLIAGGVWTAAGLVFGGQAEVVSTLHTEQLGRLDDQITELQEEEDETLLRLEAACASRLGDVKEALMGSQELLETCLEQEVRVQVTCQSPE